MNRPYVYISGALTVMDEQERERLRALYAGIGDIVEAFGFDRYFPHEHSDPTLAAHLEPRDVDDIDRTAVMNAALVIAEVSIPSHGTGIEMAHHADRSVILLAEEGKHVSRLILGNPAVIGFVRYRTLEDLRPELDALISKYRAYVSTMRIPAILKGRLYPDMKE